MNGKILFGILVTVTVILLYEWPRIPHKKEKAAFFVLTGIACVVAVILVYFPGLPNPDQCIQFLYGPLGKLLEQ